MQIIHPTDPNQIDLSYVHMDLNVLVNRIYLFHLYRLVDITFYIDPSDRILPPLAQALCPDFRGRIDIEVWLQWRSTLLGLDTR